MPVEIERKYLVTGDDWRELATGRRYLQGYLSFDPDRTVRIRVVEDSAWLTVKGRSRGAVRSEYEYPVPLDHASEMLASLCHQPLIDKIRYCVAYGGLTWEIDEFSGANAGLVIAEVELSAEDQVPDLPDWVGADVTGDARYYNACLARHPYGGWKAD